MDVIVGEDFFVNRVARVVGVLVEELEQIVNNLWTDGPQEIVVEVGNVVVVAVHACGALGV